MRPSALRAAARRTRPLPGRPYRPSSYRPAAHHPQAPHPPPLTLPPLPPPPPPAAAYVHLPFCVRRCHYCDFPVVALGARAAVGVAPAVAGATVGGRAVGRAGGGGGDSALPPPRPPVLDRYLDALLAEIRAAGEREGGRVGPPLDTVSFGGGTPSLVPPPDIARLLASLDAAFGIAPDAEISMEADPGTFDAPRLAAYVAAGVTRVSVGVQSFDDALLAACGRSHGAADVAAALAAVAAVRPPSWSLDLMSGLPGLTRAGWRETLASAVAANPDHVSVYDLQLEAGTPFGRRYTPGATPLPADADAASMLGDAASVLGAAGFERYEVSNYARPGHRSRHNQVYWRGDADYRAFGVGATSRLGGARWARPKGLAAYVAWVEAGACPPPAPPDPPEEVLLDVVMLRLRTADGLAEADVVAAFGEGAAARVGAALAPHVDGGRAARTASGWRLTDPAGFVVSNTVIADVFAALDGG